MIERRWITDLQNIQALVLVGYHVGMSAATATYPLTRCRTLSNGGLPILPTIFLIYSQSPLYPYFPTPLCFFQGTGSYFAQSITLSFGDEVWAEANVKWPKDSAVHSRLKHRGRPTTEQKRLIFSFFNGVFIRRESWNSYHMIISRALLFSLIRRLRTQRV